jgi:ATP-binding cassette subfamily F protein 3
MVSINNLFVAFGDRVLFDHVSMFIGIQDKIGLVGKNGAGKSTLLKIIMGFDKPLEGNISKSSEVTIGYLAQELEMDTSISVREACRAVFGDLLSLEKRKKELEIIIEDETKLYHKDYGIWLDELSHINESLIAHAGDKVDKKVETILYGLGFEKQEIDNAIETFSGGWQMRVELACLLLSEPKLLLLDEPTNHLDILAIEWLQGFLKNYSGGVMLISHDQLFLDQVTTRTIEISAGSLYDYKFSYSKYLEVRKAEIEVQKQKKKEQEKYIKETKVLIEKFRYKKNKASFAQGLIRKLERLEAISIDEFDTSSMRFSFQEPLRSGKVVLKVEGLSKSYNQKKVFAGLNIEIERNEKVALVGKNGTGKTTLIKIIADIIDAKSGICDIGHNVSIGYYAQDQARDLDPDITVLKTIENEATGDLFKASRKILGTFMFSGEDVDKKVKVLSGGEKSRLALCKLLLKPYNFLVLDEPTNHLDIGSKNILKAALNKYKGTLLVVSHDRDFLTGLTSRVLEIERNSVKEYLGGVSEFLDEKKKETIADFERTDRVSIQKTIASSSQKELFIKKKEKEKLLRKLNSEISKCENLMHKLEKEQSAIEDLMAHTDFYESPNHKQELEKHQVVLNKIWQVEQKWEKAMMKLEGIEKD